MEPEVTSSLKASFYEYETLGKKHREVSSRIENLNEAMKLSRQRGAFQQLQAQMKEVKELVKQKEDLDGKMAVADLARKKDDDHRLAVKQEVSYSEQLSSVGSRIAELEAQMFSYAEQAEDEFDFARCQRPDGSFYGTRGKCEAPNKEVKESSTPSQGMARSEADARSSGQPLTPAERAAYKAGGGDAAARRNKGGVDEAIDQGRRNLARRGTSFAEELVEDNLDFARCQRPDGSFYGTRGKCKKGKDAGAAPVSQSKARAARVAARPPRKETLADTKERMAGNREAYLAQKKSNLKRGPLHKEVTEARDRLKEHLPELTARKKELDRLVRAARAQEQVVKKDRSKENRERLKLILAALRDQERAVRRSEKEAEKLARQYRSLNKKNERAKMSPQQRAAEAALDREIRLRG